MAEASAKFGVLVGGSRFVNAATHELTHSFDLLDLDAPAEEAARVTLSFLAHGFALHPQRRSRAVVFEKRGPGAAHIDLASHEVLARIDPMPSHHFYGHGAFTSDGSALMAIETELATGKGIVSVRDLKSFGVIDRFPTFGESPHDCCLVDDGKTLAVTNGGGPSGGSAPSVTFVDIATQTLLERFEMSDPAINAGHLAVVRNREFVVVSAPRDGLPPDRALGGVSVHRLGRPMGYLREPKQATDRMVGESLSVCIHEASRTALVTHPYGNLITFCNLDHGAIFAALDVAHARGVTLTLDKTRFMISFGAAGGLLAIEAQPLKLMTTPVVQAGLFSGSHIYTWDRFAS